MKAAFDVEVIATVGDGSKMTTERFKTTVTVSGANELELNINAVDAAIEQALFGYWKKKTCHVLHVNSKKLDTLIQH